MVPSHSLANCAWCVLVCGLQERGNALGNTTGQHHSHQGHAHALDELQHNIGQPRWDQEGIDEPWWDEEGINWIESIWDAVQDARVDVVEQLLQDAPERAEQVHPVDGRTPMHTAATVMAFTEERDQQLGLIITLLRNHGADRDAVDAHDRTPMQLLDQHLPAIIVAARHAALAAAV